jgi:putative ABC transport system permease protein
VIPHTDRTRKVDLKSFFHPNFWRDIKVFSQTSGSPMIKNYLTIAFRALIRSKVHSAINIIGLSLGIAVCLLITLYVKDEWTFDRFHSKSDRIYRVYASEDWGENEQFEYATTPIPMGPTLKENLPEVEEQVRYTRFGTQVKVGDQSYNEPLVVVGENFFDVFDFKITNGTRDVLHKQSSVILNENYAIKYFGSADPVGKTISIQLRDNFYEFTVAAVIERAPTNSSIEFQLMISDLNFPRMYDQEALTGQWFSIEPETYVLLREGVDVKNVEAKFPALFKTVLGEERFKESKYSVGLQPITSIHLDTSYPLGEAPVSDPKYSLILGAIAVLILFVACINFVTLSIGRSLKRAKEVGVRKVVGAARKQLVTQFIGEAVLVASISMIIGVTMAVLSMQPFNNLSGKELIFPFDGFLLGIVGALLIIVGLISGSYPAFVLSGFKPASIVKPAGSKQTLRKVLVGIQLVLSIFLITSTLVMRNQLRFLQEKNLGFNKEQLVDIPMNFPRGQRMSENAERGFAKTEQFKIVLTGKPGIKEMCAAAHDFGRGRWVNVGYTDDKDVYHVFNTNFIDDDYIPVMQMELVAGRNFDDANPADKRRSLIVNEAFVKEYGWTDAIGKRLPGKKFGDHEIIGVVKDFNYLSLYKKVEPLALMMNPAVLASGIENMNVENPAIPKLLVRLNAGETSAGMEEIKKAWNQLSGGEEFRFFFVDESLNKQYATDLNLGKIVSVATILAILIGSLGLYGLASLAMQNRTKEITIRKVLGATERSLLVLLSGEYLVLIVVCLTISVPLTIYMMQGWLSTFEYRVPIGWLVFAIAGGISLSIAILTIGHQTLKTASAQPAESLKYE